MNESKILQELRDLYKLSDKQEMKKVFYKNIFFISKDNKLKIQKAIDSLPDVGPIMTESVDIFGGKLI